MAESPCEFLEPEWRAGLDVGYSRWPTDHVAYSQEGKRVARLNTRETQRMRENKGDSLF